MSSLAACFIGPASSGPVAQAAGLSGYRPLAELGKSAGGGQSRVLGRRPGLRGPVLPEVADRPAFLDVTVYDGERPECRCALY